METFTGLFKEYVKGGMGKIPYWTINKLSVDDFCEREGIPRPAIYRVWETPEEIVLDGLPDAFVVKPSNLNSARGVQIIERQNDGSLYDHFRTEATSLERIIEVQREELDKIHAKEPNRVKAYRVVAQERVEDSYSDDAVPTDFKFWVVGGEVRLVFQSAERNTGRLAVCFYDEHFEPLPDVNDRVTIKGDAQAADPVHLPVDVRSEMIEIAERAARAIPADFIRVDLYASKRGILLGELTPIPGSPVNGKVFSFTETFEALLAQAWRDASVKSTRGTSHG